jgi:hypothetical protein
MSQEQADNIKQCLSDYNKALKMQSKCDTLLSDIPPGIKLCHINDALECKKRLAEIVEEKLKAYKTAVRIFLRSQHHCEQCECACSDCD